MVHERTISSLLTKLLWVGDSLSQSKWEKLTLVIFEATHRSGFYTPSGTPQAPQHGTSLQLRVL